MNLNEQLTDVKWLSENLDSQDVVIVDCHWDSNAYLRAHIPGAIMRPGHPYIKTEDDTGNPGKHLPDADQFRNLMKTMGIDSNSTVVCYDEWHNHFATRLWWLLRYYGHDRVMILNGGWQAWVEAALPVSTLTHDPRPVGTFDININEHRLMGINDLLKNYQNDEWQIIDVRSDGEYDGSDNTAGNKRTGHIPGACHLEWNRMLKSNDNGVHFMRSLEEMRQLLGDAGVSPAKRTVVHCQSGVRATFMAYCLELLEYPDVKVYDGSMVEWANIEDTPLVS